MCGAGHREVTRQAVAESTVDSLQDWLVPHQGVRGLGLATRPQQGNRLKPRRPMVLRPEAETRRKCKGPGRKHMPLFLYN